MLNFRTPESIILVCAHSPISPEAQAAASIVVDQPLQTLSRNNLKLAV
jgi:hypothetical protein